MCTMENHTWTATTLVSSAKIILRPLELPQPTRLSLQLLFFMGVLVYNEYSTSAIIEIKN